MGSILLPKKKYFDFSSKTFQYRATLFALWVSLFIGLYLVRAVLLPFFVASLLAYVFHPLVAFLGRIKFKGRPLSRGLSVLIIYLSFALIIAVFSIVFLPQFYSEMVRLAKDASVLMNSIDDDSINKLGRSIEQFFRDYQLPLEITPPIVENSQTTFGPHKSNWLSIDLVGIFHNILNDLIIYLKSEAKSIISSAQYFVTKFISFLFLVLLVLMITGFLLVDIKSIKQFFFTLVPINDREQFSSFLARLDQRLAGVVRGQLTICLINAVLTLIGLLVLKIKFAFILASIAGIFSLVPIFGSIISTVPIVLVALTISPVKALMALVWIAFIHMLEANFLNPKILGNSSKIHPVLIVLALLTGERFYGIVGALLAVPIMSIIITVFSSILGKAKAMDEVVAKPVESDRIVL